MLVTYGAEAEPVPAVAAKSWVLADLETGEILAAKSPHLVRPPASTLKTLTALTLIPQLDPDDVYRAQLSDVMVEGSRAGLVANATYTVDDLWYALLLPSGNDAARALAHANGGIRKSVAEMNEVARHLQANDTVARSPHGLDTPGQVSSAYDLALIARAAMQLDAFRTYVSTLKHDFPGLPAKAGKKRHTFELWNQNPLLREGYRGALGVKTGYTTMAGRTFVGAAKRGDRTLVVTLMGVTEPTTTAAKKLLTWGFHEADHVTPVGVLVDPVAGPAGQPRSCPARDRCTAGHDRADHARVEPGVSRVAGRPLARCRAGRRRSCRRPARSARASTRRAQPPAPHRLRATGSLTAGPCRARRHRRRRPTQRPSGPTSP